MRGDQFDSTNSDLFNYLDSNKFKYDLLDFSGCYQLTNDSIYFEYIVHQMETHRFNYFDAYGTVSKNRDTIYIAEVRNRRYKNTIVEDAISIFRPFKISTP